MSASVQLRTPMRPARSRRSPRVVHRIHRELWNGIVVTACNVRLHPRAVTLGALEPTCKLCVRRSDVR